MSSRSDAVVAVIPARGGSKGIPRKNLVRLGGREVRTDDLGRFSIPDLPASMADREPPILEVSGRGRKSVRRALPFEAGVDDLLFHLERE